MNSVDKKTRLLTQTLLLSAALNLLLIVIFFYFVIRDNPLRFSFQPSKTRMESLPVNPAIIKQLQTYSYPQLVELLSDQKMVDHGYRVRDFALAALAEFHDFDVARALGKRHLSQRRWDFEEVALIVYPALSESDFTRLIAFAKTECLPYTTKGLLRRIETSERDTQLLTYFCHTPEFILFEQLFTRSKFPIKKGTLLGLVKEGGWDLFSGFYEQQTLQCDLSDQTLRKLLVDYLDTGSKTAAYLLLKLDGEFALKQLDDKRVAKMLELFDDRSKEAVLFAQKVALSPRGDVVRDLASQLAGRYLSSPAASPSAKELRPVFRATPPAAPAPGTHVIQPGESLWIIARKHNVSLDRLMEVNHLQSCTIQPGKTLQIPRSP